MKSRYIKTDYVPFNTPYLTAGKVYHAVGCDDRGGFICADNGEQYSVYFDQSHHLDDKAWTICDADGNLGKASQ